MCKFLAGLVSHSACKKEKSKIWINEAMGHFRVALNLVMKARLSAKLFM